MNPAAFLGLPLRRGPKRNCREIDGGFLASRDGRCAAPRLGKAEDDRKWRRKPLESLETELEMASRRFAVAQKGNIKQTPDHADAPGDRSYARRRAKPHPGRIKS